MSAVYRSLKKQATAAVLAQAIILGHSRFARFTGQHYLSDGRILALLSFPSREDALSLAQVSVAPWHPLRDVGHTSGDACRMSGNNKNTWVSSVYRRWGQPRGCVTTPSLLVTQELQCKQRECGVWDIQFLYGSISQNSLCADWHGWLLVWQHTLRIYLFKSSLSNGA